MAEDPYKAAFGLILAAGNAKSKAFEALEAAREYRFDDAEEFLKEADVEFRSAHDMQFDMLRAEAKGNPVALNIVLVHALDHLTMALMAKDNANEFIEVYKQIADLKTTLNNNTKEN